jgi:hypothetical protein
MAMRGGHDIEDFSALYELTMGDHGTAELTQLPMTQFHQAS